MWPQYNVPSNPFPSDVWLDQRCMAWPVYCQMKWEHRHRNNIKSIVLLQTWWDYSILYDVWRRDLCHSPRLSVGFGDSGGSWNTPFLIKTWAQRLSYERQVGLMLDSSQRYAQFKGGSWVAVSALRGIRTLHANRNGDTRNFGTTILYRLSFLICWVQLANQNILCICNF